MGRLSSEEILKDKQTRDPGSILHLSLTHKAVSDVSCLRDFKNLERLDLGFNNLTSLEDLRECVNLKWLSVVQNKLQSLKGIDGLTKLTVLNAGKNKIRSLDEVQKLVNLRALIMNDNEIVSICRLDELKHLNTIVVSRNPLRKMSLNNLKIMSKLSLSNCQLEAIDSSIKVCTELKELRLAHNDIKTLPDELAHNMKLQNLDLGNNLISRWSDLKVLSSLQWLENLNLHGNPIAEHDKLVKKIKKLVPSIRIFNSKPIQKYTTNEQDDTVLDFSVCDAHVLNVSKTTNKERDHDDKNKLCSMEKHKVKGADVNGGFGSNKKKPKKIVDGGGANLDVKEESEDSQHCDGTGIEKTKDFKEPSGENGTNEKRMKQKNKRINEHREKEACTQDSDKAVSEMKLKTGAGKRGFTFIYDQDIPFSELLASDTTAVPEHGNSAPEIDSLSSLVIVPTKKKMRNKGAGSFDLQALSHASEVGLGGPSAWGDE